MLFRGRELQHIEEGQRIILYMMEKLADIAKVEQAPRMEGKRMVCHAGPQGLSRPRLPCTTRPPFV